jgi:taspase (threonine aspartase 1)
VVARINHRVFSTISTTRSASSLVDSLPSISMQSPRTQDQNTQTVTRLNSARERLRQFGHILSSPLWRPRKQTFQPNFSSSQYPEECVQIVPALAPFLTLTTPLINCNIPEFSPNMDGATERMLRRSHISQGRLANVAAIFVHAGAGYHSTTNEHIHLGACDR